MLIHLLILTCIQTALSSKSCTHDHLKAVDRWQTIKSPGFPNAFPPQTQCSWRISTEAGYRVKLQFSGFNLALPNAKGKCTRQWLNIQFRDKNPDVPTRYYTLCGRDSLGTIVSPGSVLLLNLHSGSDAVGSKYMGFQASYSMTDEPAAVPGDVNKPEKDKVVPSKRTGKVIPTGGGSRYSNRRKPLTQNERIELLNRRRNQGQDVSSNPGFDTEGNLLNQPPQMKRTTSKPVTPYVPPSPPPPRAKTLSNEMKAVVIVICIIVGAFIILLVAKKFNLVQRMQKLKTIKRMDKRGGRFGIRMFEGRNKKSSGRKRRRGGSDPSGTKEETKTVKKRKTEKPLVEDERQRINKRKKNNAVAKGNGQQVKKTKPRDHETKRKAQEKQKKKKSTHKNSSVVETKAKKRRKSFGEGTSPTDSCRNTRTSHAYRAHKRPQRSPRVKTRHHERASRAKDRRASSSSSTPGYFSDSSLESFTRRRRR